MLESVVEQYQIDVGVEFQHFVNTLSAVFTHSQCNHAQELMVNLIRLIAQVLWSERFTRHDKAVSFALVATAEHTDVVFLAQFLHDVFHMWRFASAAHRDVAHRHHRHIKRLLLEYAHVEGGIAQPNPSPVNPREWSEDQLNCGLALFFV